MRARWDHESKVGQPLQRPLCVAPLDACHCMGAAGSGGNGALQGWEGSARRLRLRLLGSCVGFGLLGAVARARPVLCGRRICNAAMGRTCHAATCQESRSPGRQSTLKRPLLSTSSHPLLFAHTLCICDRRLPWSRAPFNGARGRRLLPLCVCVCVCPAGSSRRWRWNAAGCPPR